MSITYGPSDCIVESCDCTAVDCAACIAEDQPVWADDPEAPAYFGEDDECGCCSYDGPAVADTTSE